MYKFEVFIGVFKKGYIIIRQIIILARFKNQKYWILDFGFLIFFCKKLDNQNNTNKKKLKKIIVLISNWHSKFLM